MRVVGKRRRHTDAWLPCVEVELVAFEFVDAVEFLDAAEFFDAELFLVVEFFDLVEFLKTAELFDPDLVDAGQILGVEFLDVDLSSSGFASVEFVGGELLKSAEFFDVVVGSFGERGLEGRARRSVGELFRARAKDD